MERSLVLRLATTAIALPVVLLAVWYGSGWLLALVMAAVVGGLWEFDRLVQAIGARTALLLMLGMGVPLVFNGFLGWGLEGSILGAGVLGALTWQVGRVLFPLAGYSSRTAATPSALATAATGWAFTIAGPLYLGWTLAHGVLLRELPDGRDWLLLTLLTIFATDTFAYFVGRTFGSRPLAPAISPKKTVEGAIGGTLGGILAAGVLSLIVFDLPASWWQALLVGGSIAIAAQVGDLAESLLKRAAQAKSSSGLLPGHGGILDRLDSIIVGVVVAYYLTRWIIT